jgi:predicted secreted hydrolase
MLELEKFRLHKRLLLVLVILILVVSGSAMLLTESSGEESSITAMGAHQDINAGVENFQPVNPGREISLPGDFRFHPGYRQERWHFFADVIDQQGQRFSIKWHYYRIAMSHHQSSGWESPQLYIAEVVVTSGDQIWRAQRLARGGVGQAGFRARPFRLWLDNWSWRSLGLTPFPGLLSIAGDDFSLQLHSTAAGPYVLSGGHGYQQKHDTPLIGSYQFSVPFLSVAGELILNGSSVPVRGTAVLDKEWGNRVLNEGQEHQDQFFLRFNSGMTLQINRLSYPLHSTTYFGALVQPDGTKVYLQSSDIHLFPESYTQLIEGQQFPARWIIVIPKYNIRLTVAPREEGQWHPFLIPFWEGGVTATGSHHAAGYMLFSGY